MKRIAKSTNTFIDKKLYLSPELDIIKLDNQISLVLNSFNSLPGDPNPYCVTNSGENHINENLWE